MAGLEPASEGVKVPCLTTWRRPNVERNKGYNYIGIELTEEYLPISKARIEYASKHEKEKCVKTSKKTKEKSADTEVVQMSLW